MKRIAAATAFTLTTTVHGFTQSQNPAFVSISRQSQMPLQMGLFDGMKEAFSAPASMSLDSERETPIDRWMGWNVKSEEQQKVASSKFFSVFFLVVKL